MLTLEKCLNKIVHCSDGAYRRLIEITDRTLKYQVPTTKDGWIDMGSVSKREVQERFLNGVIVEKMP